MRLLCALATLPLLWSLSCAMGNTKPLVEARMQLAEQLKLADKVTGIEQAQLKLADKLEAQNVAMAGFNNTVSKVSHEIKSGRDTVSTVTNDTRVFEIQKEMFEIQKKADAQMIAVWKYLFYAILTTVVAPLLGLVTWTMKAMFREMSNSRYYQTAVAKISQNGEFDEVMRKKREIDGSKTLIAKVVRIKDTIKGAVK